MALQDATTTGGLHFNTHGTRIDALLETAVEVTLDLGMITDRHRAGDTQFGLDLTAMKDADAFDQIRKTHNLTLLEAEADHYGDPYRAFIWANDHVLVRTGNDPISGEYRYPGARPPEPGFLSYVGIEGRQADAVMLFDDIRAAATYIKDVDLSRRSFI